MGESNYQFLRIVGQRREQVVVIGQFLPVTQITALTGLSVHVQLEPRLIDDLLEVSGSRFVRSVGRGLTCRKGIQLRPAAIRRQGLAPRPVGAVPASPVELQLAAESQGAPLALATERHGTVRAVLPCVSEIIVTVLINLGDRRTGDIRHLVIAVDDLVEVRDVPEHHHQAEVDHAAHHLCFTDNALQGSPCRIGRLIQHAFDILDHIVTAVDAGIRIGIIIRIRTAIGGGGIVVGPAPVRNGPVARTLAG